MQASQLAVGGVFARVEFHKVGTHLLCGLDLVRFRFNEQAYRDVVVFQGGYELGKLVYLGSHVQAAFNGDFLVVFLHQGDHVRLHVGGKLQHFGGGGDFQVQLGGDGSTEQAYVPVLYVALVFAEVDGYAHATG